MSFLTKDIFTFDHTVQPDYPSWTPAQTKANMNARGEELRLALNAVVNLLNSITSGASGAKNVAMTPIASIGVQADVQSVVEALITRLQAITSGSGGSRFIGAETITGLTGNDVQTLLVALKTLADGYDTAQTNALTAHKTSADHDSRYYTESELGATTGAGLVGATAPSGLTGTTVQAILNALKSAIDAVALSQVPDGSITDAKLSNTSGQIKDTLTTHLADYVRQPGYAADTGIANAYVITLSPVPTSYVDGMSISAKITNASTGASTINVNGLGAKSILDSLGNAITSGGLKAGIIYSMRYNSTSGNFIVQGKGGGGNALASQLLLNKTATVDAGSITGTMPDKTGAGLIITPSNIDIAIPQAYYPGGSTDGKVAAVVVPAAKVLNDTTIAGTPGTMLNRQVTGDDYFNSSYPTLTISKGANTQYGNYGVSSPAPRLVLCPPAGFYPGGGSAYVTAEASEVASALGLTANKIVVGNNVCNIAGTAIPLTMSAGDIIILTSSNTNALTTSPQKFAEMRANMAGTIRAKETVYGGSASTVYGQIYVNGVARGTLHNYGANANQITFSDDITVNAGDLIQAYAYCSAGASGHFVSLALGITQQTSNYGTITL